jgi:hypothetical protein
LPQRYYRFSYDASLDKLSATSWELAVGKSHTIRIVAGAGAGKSVFETVRFAVR